MFKTISAALATSAAMASNYQDYDWSFDQAKIS